LSPRSFHYSDFSHKGAKYRIGAVHPEVIRNEIVKLRRELEAYIDTYPDFKGSLIPIRPAVNAPRIALSMHRAADLAGVGPLAAVAGAIAEFSARAAADSGESDVIVENGGDIFIISSRERIISLFAGGSPLSSKLALRISPARCPVAVCSSSGTMGHSMSFGTADLVTVVAADAALADAAATALCNKVRGAGDINGALEAGMEIPGLQGILIVLGGHVGIIGDLPELIRHHDADVG